MSRVGPDDVSAARVEKFVQLAFEAIVMCCHDASRPAWVFVKLGTGGIYKPTGYEKPLKADVLLRRMTSDEIKLATDRLREEKWIVDVDEHDSDVHIGVRHKDAAAMLARPPPTSTTTPPVYNGTTDLPPTYDGSVDWPPPAERPTLREGDAGPFVTLLQAMVAVYMPGGRAPNTDGVFGPETAAAVRGFQRVNHLHASGVVEPSLWARLESANSRTARVDEVF